MTTIHLSQAFSLFVNRTGTWYSVELDHKLQVISQSFDVVQSQRLYDATVVFVDQMNLHRRFEYCVFEFSLCDVDHAPSPVFSAMVFCAAVCKNENG